MSGTTPSLTAATAPPGAPTADPEPGPSWRRRTVLVAAVVLVVAAGLVITVGKPFSGASQSGVGVSDNSDPTSLTTVKQGRLSSQVNDSGTLQYAAQPDGSPYSAINQASGTYTSLPTVGQVVRCGHVLYRVTDNPVVLLCGATPAYRALSQGMTGPDVRELNRNLVALGYATRAELDPSSDYFSSETADALERLQDKLGVDETGVLALGQAVFLPEPLRISKVQVTLGSAAPPSAPVAQATSSRRQVEAALDAAEQAKVKVGDRVLITLPNNQTTPGVITSIGSVASGGGSGSGATIPVYITLKHPQDAGNLDQAPVQLQITTAGVKDALIVPVDALLALAGGGYAVETVDSRGRHQLVPVMLGLFDDAAGLVQVSSSTLAAGQQIVVPAT